MPIKFITPHTKSHNQNSFFPQIGQFRNGQSTNFRTEKDFLSAYEIVNYVYHAISTISADIASLDWELVNESGKQVSDQKIETLLNEPNPGVAYNAFMQRSVMHLLLDGNIFYLLEVLNLLDSINNNPTAIVPLNPATVKIHNSIGEIVSARTITNVIGINHYEIDEGRALGIIPPDKIVQVRIPSPHNNVRGMGKIQGNQFLLDADRLASIFLNTFYAQGASISYAVTPGEKLGKIEKERFDKDIRETYEGQHNWNKIAMLPANSTIQKLSLNQKEMQQLETRKMSREDINAILGMEPIMSGFMGDSKYDSVAEQKKVYFQTNLPRIYKPIEAGINKIISRIRPGIIFKIITKQIVDMEMQNAIARDMFDRGIRTGNEYLEMVGMATDQSNNELNQRWITFNFAPIGVALAPPEIEPTKQLKKEATGPDKIPDLSTKASSKQLQLHRQARRVKQKIEPIIRESIDKFYAKVEARAIAGLEKSVALMQTKGANINDVFVFNAELAEAVKDGRRFFTSAATLSLQNFNQFFDASIDTSFSNREMRLVVDKLSVRYADLTVNSRKAELQALLKKALDEGVGISEIKGRIQDHFESLRSGPEGWRATRIARTEASFAYDQASAIGYKEIGVTRVDVVGCEARHEPWDCNKSGFKLEDIATLNFHPNHTGTVVPAGI
jgi:HK97 family phage portal protein